VPLRSLGLRHVSSAIFAGAIAIAPVAAKADDHHDKRYYDRNARDYRTLNDKEDRAYRVYLGKQHRDYREFNKTNKGEQQR
jgi:hypothetical protein